MLSLADMQDININHILTHLVLTFDSLPLNFTNIYLPLISILMMYSIIYHQYLIGHHLSYKLVSSWMNKYSSCCRMDMKHDHPFMTDAPIVTEATLMSLINFPIMTLFFQIINPF